MIHSDSNNGITIEIKKNKPIIVDRGLNFEPFLLKVAHYPLCHHCWLFTTKNCSYYYEIRTDINIVIDRLKF